MLPLGETLVSSRWAERRASTGLLIGTVTFAILALELALIRWTSAQVRIFAYFNNIVLICAFLGIGVGVALGPRRPGLIRFALPVLLFTALPLAFSEQLNIVSLPFPDQSVMLWGGQAVPANGWIFVRNVGIFLGFLGAITATFVCCGAALGYLFGRAPTLRAYHADLIGSLLGVLAFTAVAWWQAGPAIWLALAVVPLVWVARDFVAVVCGAVVIGLGQFSVQGALYSPYNRIDLQASAGGGFELRVNRDFHQYMYDLAPASLASAGLSDDLRARRQAVKALYDLPFVVNPQRDSALVVGAGTGNDVQAALRNGYRHVTSVDIDGRIIELGRALHPEHPYRSPLTETVVDDARAFFEQDRDRKFDVVCFGLLDSHAMSSAMSTLRLDNYVYTEEGIRAAWQRVRPGGHLSLALSCMAGRWFYERLHWTITRATGREPIDYVSRVHGGTVTFIVPRGATLVAPPDVPDRGLIRPVVGQEHTLTTSDDWPFLYLRPGVFPWGYLAVIAAILVAAIVTVRRVFGLGHRDTPFSWPLFFMGAAFLLIETRGVTSLSLLFGSTWVVNSAVFTGILVMVLLGNAIVRYGQLNRPGGWYAGLFAAVLLLYVFPLGWLHALPLLMRGVIGGLLTGLPIGFAGLIVPMLLRSAKNPSAALGANLLGAVLGGCFEYLAMYTGLRAMALLALVLYLLAYLTLRRETAVTARAAEIPVGAIEGFAAD